MAKVRRYPLKALYAPLGAAIGIDDVGGLQAALDSKADDSDLTAYAPIASPGLTGAPTAPTAAPGTNTSQIASTAFVGAAVAAGGGGGGQPADATLTALAALTGAGLVEATGTDVFAMRALGVAATTSVPTRADGDTRWAAAAHAHAMADVTGLTAALAAKADDTDLAGYAPTVHTHAISDVTSLQASLDAKLPSASYTAADVLTKLLTVDGASSGLDADLLDGQSGAHYLAWANFTGVPATFTPTAHSHVIGDTTGLQAALDAKLATSAYTAADVLAKLLTVDGTGSGLDADLLDGSSSAAFAAATHAHAMADVTGLTAALAAKADDTDLAGYAPTVHTHAIADTTGLQTALDSKLATSAYTAADVLTKLLTVDGAGSGLDADTLDGQSSAAFQAAGSYQTLDATLTALAGVAAVNDRLPYFDGTDTATVMTFTAAGRAILDDADNTAQRTTLGLGTSATVNTGTSGATVPLLDGANTWSAGQTVSLTTATTPLTLVSTEAANATWTAFTIDRLSASPAASDYIGDLLWRAKDSGGTTTSFVGLRALTISPTDPTEQAWLQLITVWNGGFAVRATLGQGLFMAGATGNDKGAGTINAIGVYDDNVLLTCMPMQPEFRATGTLDLDKWDALSPTGQHPAAHIFDALLKSGCDPRQPQSYVERAQRDGALPGMPTRETWQHGEISTGEIITRLWLAVEMLASAWMAERAAKDSS